MSRTGIDTTGLAAAEGEVESFTVDRIVIAGIFYPGDSLEFRTGRRVALFTEAAPPGQCPDCDEADSTAGDLRDENETLQGDLEDRDSKILDLEGQLVDARENADAMLQTIGEKQARIETLERALAEAVHEA